MIWDFHELCLRPVFLNSEYPKPMAIQESDSPKQVQLRCCWGGEGGVIFVSVSPVTSFPFWHMQICLSLLELTHDCPGRLEPIPFVQPFQMYPINTTSQRKVFYLTPSCRPCTQMNILVLHTLSCTKIRHVWVLAVTSVIEQDYWLSFHLKVLISWEIWAISPWRFGILNKVYGILDLKMCRARYTKKIV